MILLEDDGPKWSDDDEGMTVASQTFDRMVYSIFNFPSEPRPRMRTSCWPRAARGGGGCGRRATARAASPSPAGAQTSSPGMKTTSTTRTRPSSTTAGTRSTTSSSMTWQSRNWTDTIIDWTFSERKSRRKSRYGRFNFLYCSKYVWNNCYNLNN